ncbi:MAG: indole-3-glycerol phosphate synthase TrpC [Paludibacteraceae bacterium]|nr:indole-3-glycerol phosphate synthase TrpC [Paludibacteraceae bacterium]
MTQDILSNITAQKRIEVAKDKSLTPPAVLYKSVEHLMSENSDTRSMSGSLMASAHGIIAEFKRKSPSKGWIHPDVEPEDVVPRYAKAGAAALSILTDTEFFGGCREFIKRVRPMVQTPILRKDFIIDEYQIFQAKEIGADAVLLIAACLSKQECESLINMAHNLNLEVLLEMHSESELDYATLGADMLGINNRNLGTFVTDVNNSFKMAELLPKDKLKVSESGISNPETIRQLRAAGFRGFLIGETFMKESNPGAALENFIKNIAE